MQIREIGEFGLIQRLKQRKKFSDPSVIKGIGDDCAVVRISNDQCLLLTCDLLLEGVHFHLTYTDSYHLGKKALAVNLSDIAAMGGTPRFYLTSLGLPPALRFSFVEGLYQGMEEVAKEYKVSLIGGNISSSRKIIVDLTVIGESRPHETVYRNGARTGDSIFVTGTLGDSSLGLNFLKSRRKVKETPAVRKLIEKHLSPQPRLKEGKFIAVQKLATAMIDISDGLISDLQHILEESRQGAEIWIERLPLSSEVIECSKIYRKKSFDLALAGGEDYELLFTVPQDRLQKHFRLSSQLSLPVTMIGKITGEKGKVRLVKNGKPYFLKREGFSHF